MAYDKNTKLISLDKVVIGDKEFSMIIRDKKMLKQNDNWKVLLGIVFICIITILFANWLYEIVSTIDFFGLFVIGLIIMPFFYYCFMLIKAIFG